LTPRKFSLKRSLSCSSGITLKLISKAQYELRFKKWQFRKYRSKDDWIVVARKIGKRKREHKESEVYIDGKLIQPKKVKKTTLRYGSTPAVNEMLLQGKLLLCNNHLRIC